MGFAEMKQLQILLILVSCAFGLNPVFSKIGHSNGQPWINDLVVDRQGDLFVLGDFYGDMLFDNSYTFSCESRSAFYAKIAEDGTIYSIDYIDAPTTSLALCIDSSDNIYMSGTFSGRIAIGGVDLVSEEKGNIWLTKYTNDLEVE